MSSEPLREMSMFVVTVLFPFQEPFPVQYDRHDSSCRGFASPELGRSPHPLRLFSLTECV